jgi:hypothetical protein
MARLPDYMPIVAGLMGAHDSPVYDERELTAALPLCDAAGNLNSEAIGWSRTPLVTANLHGHWPRKKRWNFWNWISPDFVFSVTVADIDLASFCAVAFIDLRSGERLDGTDLRRSGFTTMPDQVERSIAWRSRKTTYALRDAGDTIEVELDCASVHGTPVRAAFVMRRPPRHESLNIVVPWSRMRFQLNSKHNTLPCEGWFSVGDRRFTMQPETCHGVQDYGRGIWPYRSFWNWAVATGVQNGDLVGVNMGAKWTTGTYANENGILLGGRLSKVMEDLEWTYEPSNWMSPWRVRAPHSGMIDLTLTPTLIKTVGLNLGLLASGGTVAFGSWSGVVRAEGREVRLDRVMGWAEEFGHRW